MDTHESPAQEATADSGDSSTRSQPISERDSIPPATAPTPSSSRSRQPWSRLQSAKDRLGSLGSPSQPQPRDDGPSSQRGSLPKDDDTSTRPFPKTATHDLPASEHNQDKSELDNRNPPPKSSEQGDDTAPPLMSVGKAAEDATNLLDLNLGAILWSLVYRVIYLEHRQGFHQEEHEKVQNFSVKVGKKLRDMHSRIEQRPKEAPVEQSGTEKTQTPTEAKPESIKIATGQTPTTTKPAMPKVTVAELPGYFAQVTKVLRTFQVESPKTITAKSAWVRDLEEIVKMRVGPLQDHAEAILAAENVSQREKTAIAKSARAMFLLFPAINKKHEKIRAAIEEAKTAGLPNVLETIADQVPEETQEALTQAIQDTQKLKALRRTVAQLPEMAEDTELPIALKLRAAQTVDTLRRARTTLPTTLQGRGVETAHICKEFQVAEAAITARLKLTGVTAEEPPAAGCKHVGPTYPWGIFQELEETAKTTMDYEVSMARQYSEECRANLRDATGTQLRSKKIKFLLISIMTQGYDLAMDLVLRANKGGTLCHGGQQIKL